MRFSLAVRERSMDLEVLIERKGEEERFGKKEVSEVFRRGERTVVAAVVCVARITSFSFVFRRDFSWRRAV